MIFTFILIVKKQTNKQSKTKQNKIKKQKQKPEFCHHTYIDDICQQHKIQKILRQVSARIFLKIIRFEYSYVSLFPG